MGGHGDMGADGPRYWESNSEWGGTGIEGTPGVWMSLGVGTWTLGVLLRDMWRTP